MTAVPRVSVRTSVRMPMRPRVGTMKSSRTRPDPWFTILAISPRRSAIFSIITPVKASGMSMETSSNGSWRTPSTIRVMTSGLETASSNPSRRMFSIRMAIWSSPRPMTLNESAPSVGSIFRATLVRSSLSSRSLMWREVTYLPSRPAMGEVLIENTIDRVGSSMCRGGSGWGSSTLVTVSPMLTSEKPASATMSPAWASSHSRRWISSKVKSLVILAVVVVPSRRTSATFSPVFTVPSKTRPMARRPR